MRKFNQEFKKKLWELIADIENNSLVEVVTIVKPRSEAYLDASLIWGVIFSFVSYTLFMFLPVVFGDYLIYGGTIGAFFIGFFISIIIKPLLRIIIGKKRMKRSVEIMGRAIFQKGGIRHTNDKIGTLFFISVFEKMIYILPDRGAETLVPMSEWEKLESEFTKIFQSMNPAKAFLDELEKCKPVFAKYIPPIENDINELPDNLEIDL